MADSDWVSVLKAGSRQQFQGGGLQDCRTDPTPRNTARNPESLLKASPGSSSYTKFSLQQVPGHSTSSKDHVADDGMAPSLSDDSGAASPPMQHPDSPKTCSDAATNRSSQGVGGAANAQQREGRPKASNSSSATQNRSTNIEGSNKSIYISTVPKKPVLNTEDPNYRDAVDTAAGAPPLSKQQGPDAADAKASSHAPAKLIEGTSSSSQYSRDKTFPAADLFQRLATALSMPPSSQRPNAHTPGGSSHRTIDHTSSVPEHRSYDKKTPNFGSSRNQEGSRVMRLPASTVRLGNSAKQFFSQHGGWNRSALGFVSILTLISAGKISKRVVDCYILVCCWRCSPEWMKVHHEHPGKIILHCVMSYNTDLETKTFYY